MDITLEKIELVKDRTGCTYAEAKAALEAAEGSVVDAIIAMEEMSNAEHDRIDGASLKDSPVFAKMKSIVEKGNVSKISIAKNGKKIISFPVTVGVVGTVLVPWGAVLAAVAAMGAKCEIELIDDKGKVIDIEGKVVETYEKAKGAAEKGVVKFGGEATLNSLKKSVDDIANKAKKTVKDLVVEDYTAGTGLQEDAEQPADEGTGLPENEE